MSGIPHRGRGGGRGGRGRGGGFDGEGRGSGRGGGRGGRGDFRGDSRGGRGDFRGGHSRPGGGGPPGQQQFPYRPAPGGGSSDRLRSGGPPSVPPGIYLSSPTPPDPKITALEDKNVAVTKGKMFDGEGDFKGFPGRVSYGTKGTPIVLRTNYLALQFAHDVAKKATQTTLYRYGVEILPEQPKAKTRRVLEHIVSTAEFSGADRVSATDYANIIVTTTQSQPKTAIGTKGKDIELVIPPIGSSNVPGGLDANAPPHVRSARARDTVKYRLTYKGSFSAQHLMDYLTSTSAGAEYAGRGDLIQMLNIIMCKAPNETPAVANMPGNRFYPHHGALGVNNHPLMDFAELTGGLVALRGYFASVRPATGRILLNLNVTSGVFYPPVPLTDLVRMSGIQGNAAVEMFIRKLKVNYEHGGPKPMKKQKTIFGFAKTPPSTKKDPKPLTIERFGNAKNVRFKYVDRNGDNSQEKITSVFDYFQNQLGITLKQHGLPVLNVGTLAEPIYIPAEFCTVVPGQPYRKLLSGDQTTQMLAFAARFPNQNAMSITGDSQRSGTGLQLFQLSGPNSDLQAQSTAPFGFQVGTSMITVPGRILQAPTVQYAKKPAKPFNGSWNCADQIFVKGGKFTGWAACVLNVRGRDTLRKNPQGDMLPRDELIGSLRSYLNSYGLQMGNWGAIAERTLEPLNLDNRAQNSTILDALFSDASKRPINMLFIVLPDTDKWLYAKIKFYADTKYGIHTICSVGSKLQKPNGQGMYMGNLALKFNTKGEGINHTIGNTLINPLDNSTMLMGIDVTHPSPTSAKGAPSIACVVASKDRHLCQWPGSIRKQKGKQEMVDDKERKEGDTVKSLEGMIIERLECWQKNNQNQLPKKVLVYRDGVSEGQYQLVLQQELPHFEAAFTKKYGAPKNHPKIAIIVVGKRHHTRFYPTSEKDADYNPQRQKGSMNPKPGTVVDRGITGKIIHEFYLQAHQGLQGTARPAHYVVIKDDIGFNADSLEQITHHLCYMFVRATKAVSIVPPAYYADLLAERARAYMYNTLQEAHNRDDSSTASGGAEEWNGEIHPNLKNSFFYI